MALELKNSYFIRIPKTGSSWCQSAIVRNKLLVKEIDYCHSGVDLLLKKFRNNVLKRKFMFAAVRNPVNWYISRWCFIGKRFRHPRGYQQPLNILPNESNDFNRWLNRINTKFPGWYQQCIIDLIGNKMDFVCKQENLTEDFITALQMSGEDFNEQGIRAVKIVNEAAPRLKKIALYNKKNLQTVLEQNRMIFRKYEYDRDFQTYEKYLL